MFEFTVPETTFELPLWALWAGGVLLYLSVGGLVAVPFVRWMRKPTKLGYVVNDREDCQLAAVGCLFLWPALAVVVSAFVSLYLPSRLIVWLAGVKE